MFKLIVGLKLTEVLCDALSFTGCVPHITHTECNKKMFFRAATLATTCQSVAYRCQLYNEANGGHFEHMH